MRWLVLLAACAAPPPPVAKPAPPPVIVQAPKSEYHDPDHARGALPSADARIAELADVRAKLTAMYAHRLDKEQRWQLDEDALFRDAQARLAGAATWAQYDAAIYALLARFHDGHLSYHPPSTAAPKRGYDAYRLGFTTRLGSDRLFVATADADAPVKVGDELTAVDGVELKQVLAHEVERRAWSRPEQARSDWAQTWTSVLYPKGEPPRQRSVTVGGKAIAIAPKLRTEKEQRITTAVAADATWVRIATLDPAKGRLQAIDTALANARGAHAIVLDLRGVRGGVDTVGERVLADLGEGELVLVLGSFRALVPPETIAKRPRWKHLVAGADGFSAEEKLVVHGLPAGKGFHGPIAVMIDAGCASTCESLVAALRANLHAVLIGETTAGSSGAPIEVAIASGGSLAIPTWNLISAEGKLIEGEGISPDVIAVPSPSDPDPAPAAARASVSQPSVRVP